MFLCAVTPGSAFGPPSVQRNERLVELARSWARGGVQLIQIREKDLSSAQLLDLASTLVEAVHADSAATRVLLNGPAAIALASGADGIHLRSDARHDAVQAARHTFHTHRLLISASCHTLADVARARHSSVDFILFAPVYAKRLPTGEVLSGSGLPLLTEACAAARPIPVLALGGVTASNARECLAAGAAGIAAIRLFEQNDWQSLTVANALATP